MSSKFGRFPTIQTGSIGSIMADERRVIIDEVELEVDGSMTLIQACKLKGLSHAYSSFQFLDRSKLYCFHQ